MIIRQYNVSNPQEPQNIYRSKAGKIAPLFLNQNIPLLKTHPKHSIQKQPTSTKPCTYPLFIAELMKTFPS
jgi:hypothetical protein